MLVLSRRVGEKIRIGTSIVVTLLKLDRNKARIGVEAPADVPVLRQELFDFARERAQASAAGSRTVASSSLGRDPRPERRQARGFSVPSCLWDGAKV